MVVDEVNVESVAAFQTEGHAVVRPDSHGMKACKIAFERMKPETRQIHVLDTPGTVQNDKDIFDLLNVVGSNSFFLSVFKEPF